MSITLEGVSYSYKAPAQKKRSKKKRQSETILPSPAWGNESQNIWALQDISLTLHDSEFLGIAGHTGSGKSTLIQHMNGLIKPTSGRVLINGEDLSEKKKANDFKGTVGLVMQYPEYQLFAATVYDDVAFGPRNMGLSHDEIDTRVKEALDMVTLDFDEVSSKSPFELSGGQQRRVAFAGVLAMKPSVLILDEPVAGLDPASRSDFLNLIKGFHKQGLTIVMVSHNMDNLALLCDRILILNKGRIHALGTPSEVYSDASGLKDIGLGVPHAQHLANALKEQGLDLQSRLYDIDSLTTDLASLYKESQGC